MSDDDNGRYLAANETIDGEELANACRRLGISGPLEPLLRELKKDKDSHRRHTHKSERKSSKHSKQCEDTVVLDVNTTSSKNGKTSTYGQESWGRDSGARDLSPEPQSHHHRVPASTDSQLTDTETGGGTSSMIHLANKVRKSIMLLYSYILFNHYKLLLVPDNFLN